MALLVPTLDPDSDLPLGEQIEGYYRELIESGQLRAGQRLPTIRAVAEALGVARAAVQEAYRRLGESGLIEGTVGRGTTVLGGVGATVGPLSPFAAGALRRARELSARRPMPPGGAAVADFSELNPDGALFPVEDLRTAIDRALQERGAELLGYGHPDGLVELREVLAARQRLADPAAAPAGILITSGAQQGLDLALRTLASQGDAVVVPVPTYHQMIGLLQAHGLRLVPVPSGSDGIDLQELARALARDDVRLLYLMPTFHNPTGRSLDLAQRRALMDVVARTRVPVLEDEYQHWLRIRGEPLPSLRGLDPRGLTMTVRTFSKVLFPGLRLGWIEAAPALLEPMAAVKRFMDLETSPLLQAALVDFVQRGCLDRYLERLRQELFRRHGTAQRAFLQSLPPQCQVTDPDGGFLLWLEMPEPGQGDRLAELAADRGVRVLPGRAFDPEGRPSAGCRLSLARADLAHIEAGAAVLGDCARAVLAPAAPPARLLL